MNTEELTFVIVAEHLNTDPEELVNEFCRYFAAVSWKEPPTPEQREGILREWLRKRNDAADELLH